jgi:predicted nucleic acid-binding protein
MILTDTSIWIDHLRSSDSHLIHLLDRELLWMHPWVVGEIACGTLANRKAVLTNLQKLPRVHPAREDEVLFMLENHTLMGRGIGYIDLHLLAAARLNGIRLWTRDKRLHKTASDLQIAYVAPPGYGLPS